MATFKEKAVKAYENSIASKLKEEDDRKRRDFDVHMTQFVNKLRAIKVLDAMPKGWTPSDYMVTVDGVTLLFEPLPTQSVLMPMFCKKCKGITRKLPVLSLESIGRNVQVIESESLLCADCMAGTENTRERTWWEHFERGLNMYMDTNAKYLYNKDGK